VTVGGRHSGLRSDGWYGGAAEDARRGAERDTGKKCRGLRQDRSQACRAYRQATAAASGDGAGDTSTEAVQHFYGECVRKI